jgi:hypothetical protein
MEEVTRQAYLGSMGIQSYFPRYILPVAKQSEQCEWPELIKQEKSVRTGLGDLKDSLESESSTTVPDDATDKPTEEGKPKSAGEAEEVRFQLAMVHINNELLVLALLPYMQASNALNSIQKQLVNNIFNALFEMPVNLNLEIKPFRWPFSEAHHIEKGASAAKASLAAYLQQLQEKFSFNRLLVMGEKIAPLLGTENDYEIMVCRSLDEMLKMPQLKREVWQQLNRKLQID